MANKFEINHVFLTAPLRFGSVLLYQIGRMHCDETTVIDTHIQIDLYELTVVTGGKGYITGNNVTVPVQTGDIYCSFPFDTHKIVSDAHSPLQFDFIAFNTVDETAKADLDKIQEVFKNPSFRTFRSDRINQLLTGCLYEFSKERLYHEEIVVCSLQMILLYTCRAFLQREESVRTHITEKEMLCFQVMHYIDTHLYTIRALKEVSEAFGYTYSHLSTLFRQTMKTSLTTYYETKKFNLARQMITADNAKILEAAERLGYSTPYAFSKAYKNYFHISPKQEQLAYRKELGE